MRKASLCLSCRIAILCTFLIAASASAFAGPVGVSYTVSGSSGDWILNFSVTNNVNSGQVVYAFGVLLPAQDVVSSPANWINCFNGCSTTTWDPNTQGHGGPNVTFNNLWLEHGGPANAILFGSTFSDFEVQVDTVTAPTSVQWFANAFDNTPNGTSPYLGGDEFKYGPESFCVGNGFTSCLQEEQFNPGFDGIAFAAGATPEPSSLLLLGTGLLGLGPFIRRRFGQSSSRSC